MPHSSGQIAAKHGWHPGSVKAEGRPPASNSPHRHRGRGGQRHRVPHLTATQLLARPVLQRHLSGESGRLDYRDGIERVVQDAVPD